MNAKRLFTMDSMTILAAQAGARSANVYIRTVGPVFCYAFPLGGPSCSRVDQVWPFQSGFIVMNSSTGVIYTVVYGVRQMFAKS